MREMVVIFLVLWTVVMATCAAYNVGIIMTRLRTIESYQQYSEEVHEAVTRHLIRDQRRREKNLDIEE